MGKHQQMGMIYQSQSNLHSSGDIEHRAYLGMRYGSETWALQTGFEKPMGSQNDAFYEYTDNDSIWSISVEKKY
jgi:hypothetical protein